MTAEVIIRRDDGTVLVRNTHRLGGPIPTWVSHPVTGPLIADGWLLDGYVLWADVRPVAPPFGVSPLAAFADPPDVPLTAGVPNG